MGVGPAARKTSATSTQTKGLVMVTYLLPTSATLARSETKRLTSRSQCPALVSELCSTTKTTTVKGVITTTERRHVRSKCPERPTYRIGDVVDDHDAVGAAIVRTRDRMKALGA